MPYINTATQDFSRQSPADDRPARSLPTPTLATVLDAFELDEMADPLPEYGDFWLEKTR